MKSRNQKERVRTKKQENPRRNVIKNSNRSVQNKEKKMQHPVGTWLL